MCGDKYVPLRFTLIEEEEVPVYGLFSLVGSVDPLIYLCNSLSLELAKRCLGKPGGGAIIGKGSILIMRLLPAFSVVLLEPVTYIERAQLEDKGGLFTTGFSQKRCRT